MTDEDDGQDNVTPIGVNPATGEPVTLSVDRCRLAMSELRQAGIPLYEVEPLRKEIRNLRQQADYLREQAMELEAKANEFEGLVAICGRRDMELGVKGMMLKDGRVVMRDGNNVRPS